MALHPWPLVSDKERNDGICRMNCSRSIWVPWKKYFGYNRSGFFQPLVSKRHLLVSAALCLPWSVPVQLNQSTPARRLFVVLIVLIRDVKLQLTNVRCVTCAVVCRAHRRSSTTTDSAWGAAATAGRVTWPQWRHRGGEQSSVGESGGRWADCRTIQTSAASQGCHHCTHPT